MLGVCLLLGLPLAAEAQQAPAAPNAEGGADGRAAATQQAALDVNRLPVNLQRIQRQLAQSTRERQERDGVNLRFIIDVFGQAPPIEIFDPNDPNILNGPVPYGAPTHREMIYMITPQEFRSPVMDFSALGRWLAGKKK